MAGTIVASTLSDGTNSTSTTNCIQGSAKAWSSFTSTGSISASYNVSSITKNGTGDYSVNFTNALTDANYVVSGTTVAGYTFYTISKTSSAARVGTWYGGSALDLACNVAIHR